MSMADDPGMATETRKAKITGMHREEARLLKEIWSREKRPSQKAFGEAYDIGSQAMVANYLNAISPLNLAAASSFARGLGCSIADFSPRLADEAARIGGGDPPPPELRAGTSWERPRAVDELVAAAGVIARALQTSDKGARAAVAHLFSMLGDDPEEVGLIAQRIAFLVHPLAAGQKSSEDQSPQKPGGRDITARLDEAHDGSSTAAGEEEERRSGAGGNAGGDAGQR